jgi:hypothetical protein
MVISSHGRCREGGHHRHCGRRVFIGVVDGYVEPAGMSFFVEVDLSFPSEQM